MVKTNKSGGRANGGNSGTGRANGGTGRKKTAAGNGRPPVVLRAGNGSGPPSPATVAAAVAVAAVAAAGNGQPGPVAVAAESVKPVALTEAAAAGRQWPKYTEKCVTTLVLIHPDGRIGSCVVARGVDSAESARDTLSGLPKVAYSLAGGGQYIDAASGNPKPAGKIKDAVPGAELVQHLASSVSPVLVK